MNILRDLKENIWYNTVKNTGIEILYANPSFLGTTLSFETVVT